MVQLVIILVYMLVEFYFHSSLYVNSLIKLYTLYHCLTISSYNLIIFIMILF